MLEQLVHPLQKMDLKQWWRNMQQKATPFDPKATDTLEYDVEIKNEDLLAAITEMRNSNH